MTNHLDLLPGLIETCASIHPQCGVVLIGSVARGTERPKSDIDLNIIFPGDEVPLNRSPYIADDNRWQLQVKDVIEGFRIDVAWETHDALLDRLQSDEVVNCWPFSQGRVLHDPDHIAGPCLEIAKAWFATHPEVTSRFQHTYAQAKAEQIRRRSET